MVININGTEIDFSKQRGYFFHMDCMKALKEMPDKSVSLAIVDPPYGAGFTEGGGCQGWFSKYHQDEKPTDNKELGVHFHGRGRSKRYEEAHNDESSQFCNVERERERVGQAEVEQVWRRQIRPIQESGELQTRQGGGEFRQVQERPLTTHSESGSAARVTRTGGTWAEKYAKNHFVGHGPGKRVFSRAFSCLTESNNLGR